eukprot:3592408-Amphidinium_carterae.2
MKWTQPKEGAGLTQHLLLQYFNSTLVDRRGDTAQVILALGDALFFIKRKTDTQMTTSVVLHLD